MPSTAGSHGDHQDPGHEAWAVIAELFFGGSVHDRFHEAGESIGVNPPGLKALLSLEPGQPKPMRVLAAEWRCDPSWVTSLVDGLEERGLVERQILPTDRRVKTVALTASGAEAKAAALLALSQPPPEIEALSHADKVALRDIFRRVGVVAAPALP
ncbi:MAG TPA: MarR family winged helix-turn-helix transcriptional regulator [Acidimicrobiales bacterium]